MTDLEQRVARLEAREEIRELVTTYCMACDDRDIATLGQLFTEDGTFGHADGAVDNRGRQAIVSFYRERLAEMGPTYHYPHGHRIEFDDDSTASGVVLSHAELDFGGGTYYAGMRYLDRYQRNEGTWQFAERSLKFLFFMPLEEFAAGALGAADRKRFPGQDPRGTDLPEGQPSWQEFVAG
jgi:uncharacterized protein (TIGR02246 family)